MLPDVLPAARAFLAADAAVAELVGTRVFAHRTPPGYPPDSQAWLVLTPIVERSITNTSIDRTNDVSIQLEAFGRYLEDHKHARLTVATAHDALRSGFPGYDGDPDVRVTSVLPSAGIQPIPDDEFNRPRCIATVRVIAHPKVPVA